MSTEKRQIDTTWIGHRLKHIRKIRGYTQQEIADLLDISKAYVSNIEKGKREPGTHLKKAIEKWLEDGDIHPTTKTALQKIKEGQESAAEIYHSYAASKHHDSKLTDLVRIPILGQVPAGIPESVEEATEGYVMLPGANPHSYALKVVGNSMEPTIRHGDYVLFVIGGDPKPGDIVVVNDEFGESMIKRLKGKDGEFFLVSDNPAYPTYQPNGNYRIMGIVIDGWSRLNIR